MLKTSFHRFNMPHGHDESMLSTYLAHVFGSEELTSTRKNTPPHLLFRSNEIIWMLSSSNRKKTYIFTLKGQHTSCGKTRRRPPSKDKFGHLV